MILYEMTEPDLHECLTSEDPEIRLKTTAVRLAMERRITATRQLAKRGVYMKKNTGESVRVQEKSDNEALNDEVLMDRSLTPEIKELWEIILRKTRETENEGQLKPGEIYIKCYETICRGYPYMDEDMIGMVADRMLFGGILGWKEWATLVTRESMTRMAIKLLDEKEGDYLAWKEIGKIYAKKEKNERFPMFFETDLYQRSPQAEETRRVDRRKIGLKEMEENEGHKTQGDDREKNLEEHFRSCDTMRMLRKDKLKELSMILTEAWSNDLMGLTNERSSTALFKGHGMFTSERKYECGYAIEDREEDTRAQNNECYQWEQESMKGERNGERLERSQRGELSKEQLTIVFHPFIGCTWDPNEAKRRMTKQSMTLEGLYYVSSV